jgi:hypothetical protein
MDENLICDICAVQGAEEAVVSSNTENTLLEPVGTARGGNYCLTCLPVGLDTLFAEVKAAILAAAGE